MIITKEIKINKIADLSNEYIENELNKIEIKPLRWAIVDINEKTYTLSVANLKE